jgi:type I restriction enzyme S subunit
MKNVAKRDFRNVVVPRPPKDERDEIARLLNIIDLQIEANFTKVKALHEIKRSLLQNLLSGKIRIPEGVVHA